MRMKFVYVFVLLIFCASSVLASPNYFNSTWNTSKIGASNSTSILLPLESTGTYNFTVNWGDGTSDLITVYNQAAVTHNYDSAGAYNVSINGTIVGWRFYGYTDAQKIIDISNWGPLNVGNDNGYFYGCSNLGLTATDNLNLTGTTDMSHMFDRATNFDGNISGWDVSGVTDMSHMFDFDSAFNQSLSNWNTSSVTDMKYMFSGATSFNGNISTLDTSKVINMSHMFGSSADYTDGATSFNQPLNTWNTSSVTDMDHMFYRATSFNQSLSNWNTSSVTTMSYMFGSSTSFNQNLSSWDVSKVTDMGYMFYLATSFNQPLNTWNTSSVTTMSNMFQSAHAFNKPLNNLDVSKVTDMSQMFYGDKYFNQSLSNWNTSSVTTMFNMFAYVTNFNGNISTWNTSSVITMSGMFHSATNFNGNISNWDVSKVTTMSQMFDHSTSFNQPLNTWNTSSVTTMDSMFFWSTSFNQPLSSWDVSKVTTMSWMFYGDKYFNQSLSNWNTSSVTTMSYMFSGSTSFNGNISNWDVSKVTDMNQMFYLATSFNQPLNTWDTSSVNIMNQMFYLATSFNQPLNTWNTSSVTTMSGMFWNATSFNQPLSSWNVSKVTNMYRMFAYATSFNQPLSSWNVSSVISMREMFYHDISFNGNISTWDTSSVTTMSGMFYYATNFNQPLSSWNVSSVTDMTSMFHGITLSSPNYDSILNGWASLPSLQNSVTFDGGNSEYSSNATSARNTILIGNNNWIITDGGFVDRAPIIFSPINTTYDNVNISLKYSVPVSGVDKVWFSYNGVNKTISGNATFNGLNNNQESNLTLYINHTNGHTNFTTIGFRVHAKVGVELNSPTINLMTSSSQVTFNWTSTPPFPSNLTNSTIYVWNFNGTLYEKETVSLSGMDAMNKIYTMNLRDGNFIWNVKSCSDQADCDFASSNFSLDIGVWKYKKKIIVSENSGENLTDYPKLLYITYNSHMNSNFSDLRFMDSDGITGLHYWIKNYTASVGAWVYVKIPRLNASGNTNIYMYYGNSKAITTSDWDTTLLPYRDSFLGNVTVIGRADFGTTVFNNKIWVYGGYDNNWNALNDVWYSSNGINWTEATPNASWSQRDYLGSTVFNNKIWVYGGNNNSGKSLNDVWYSSNGINWTEATPNASWANRSDFGTTVLNNKILVYGGWNNSWYILNDTWSMIGGNATSNPTYTIGSEMISLAKIASGVKHSGVIGGGWPVIVGHIRTMFDREVLQRGYRVSLNETQVIRFKLNGEIHTLRINNISENLVQIALFSKPMYLNMTVGETRKVDLNGDGVDDLSIYLDKIISGKANFILTEINETVQGNVTNYTKDNGVGKVTEANKGGESFLHEVLHSVIFWIILSLAIIFIIFVVMKIQKSKMAKFNSYYK